MKYLATSARLIAFCIALVIAPSHMCSAKPPGTPGGEFTHPQRVTIRGYNGDAMEPFLTRDGRYLFFNASLPKSETGPEPSPCKAKTNSARPE